MGVTLYKHSRTAIYIFVKKCALIITSSASIHQGIKSLILIIDRVWMVDVSVSGSF
jgi:hypothetical protein